ncbi:phage integrase family protein [Pseudomonas sp. St290]|nr:phage integrase family protein [Pseudomonas sp. St290]
MRKDGVSVSFIYRYRWGDQNKEYACGTWPRKSLTDIRKARNQAHALIDEPPDVQLVQKAPTLAGVTG